MCMQSHLFRLFPFVSVFDLANPEILHFKITAEYSHKCTKVELNYFFIPMSVVMCVCVCVPLNFSHFSFVGCPQVHVHAHVIFRGGKCRLCSSGCHWFIGLNALILCPEERRENRKSERETQGKMLVCLCACLFVYEHEHEHCLNTSSWIKASARVSLSNWSCGMCTTRWERKKSRKKSNLIFHFLCL